MSPNLLPSLSKSKENNSCLYLTTNIRANIITAIKAEVMSLFLIAGLSLQNKYIMIMNIVLNIGVKAKFLNPDKADAIMAEIMKSEREITK